MTRSETSPIAAAGPAGIGGWLLLPLIGLVLTLLSSPQVFTQFSGMSEALPLLSGAQGAFLVAEVAGNALLLVVMPIALLVLAYRAKRSFPTWYIRWAIAGAAFIVFDLALAKVLFPQVFPTIASLFDDAMVKEVIRSAILLVVWVPYMLNSRRVTNTFVN